MAPKSAIAAEQEDHSRPMLKLVIEKGPLSGQTIEFKPGSRIRVGRVVRGNALSIKDAGVSSQHLLIQSEPTSDPGRPHWTITDLGSSNGTVLNGSQIETSVPVTLSDGDVVKIGETTAIKVKFEVIDGGSEGKSGSAGRYVTRSVKNKGTELGVIDENSELRLDGNYLGNRYNLRGKGANEKIGILGSEDGKLGAECEGKVSGRRTRGSKSRDLVSVVGEEVEGKIEGVGKFSLRRTKSSIKEEILENLTTGIHENEGKFNNVSVVEGKGGKNASVRTRSLIKDQNLGDDFKGVVSVGGQRVGSRRTRSSRKEENLLEIVIDSDIIEGKRTRKGTRGKSSLREGTSLEDKTEKESNLEHKDYEEERRKFEAEVDELVEEGINSVSKGIAGFASTSGVTRNEEPMVDLKKMTLGDWFDFLEVYLPKQIIDTTEEMISGMRQKAEKLQEFMLEQRNA